MPFIIAFKLLILYIKNNRSEYRAKMWTPTQELESLRGSYRCSRLILILLYTCIDKASFLFSSFSRTLYGCGVESQANDVMFSCNKSWNK